MLKMRVHGLISAGAVFVQVLPPSAVSCSSPSPVPAHSTFTSSGEGASAVIDPIGAGVTVDAYLPAFAGTSQVCRVRSSLMALQLCPPLEVFHTRCVA